MPGGLLPIRRTAGHLKDTDRPIRLPHLEVAATGIRFLGDPLDSDLFGTAMLGLWESCDGERPLRSWAEAQQQLLRRWHSAGLIVGSRPARTVEPANLTIVSPHPDDAALALGALLAATGGRVLDVFSEETWTRRPYYHARPELTAALLLAEERVACQVLGAELTLLGHVDGAARLAWRDGFFVDQENVAESVAVEPELFDRLINDLGSELSGDGPVLVPLAVGGHIDHVLARAAVLAKGVLNPARVMFYEDMPYSLFADAAKAAASVADEANLGPLRPLLLTASPVGADRKREALWAYRLQVTEGISSRVIRYGNSLTNTAFTERLWIPEAAEDLASDLLTADQAGNDSLEIGDSCW